MNYEINILVNGSRCKQFSHNGKLFVEAKKGSEYSIEIKNNTWQRILAVCSVDGLDVLNGQPATENGNGYVINGNNSLKIDGFRVSNEKVAKFLFDYKGKSYATSKEDGSEKNVGVIGIRLFNEKIKPLPPTPVEEHHHHHHHHDHYPKYPTNPWTPYYGSPTIWGSNILRSTCDSPSGGPTMDCCDSEPLGLFDTSNDECKYSADLSALKTRGVKSGLCCAPDPIGFDMGTKFGEAKESRVVEVEFEKNGIALTQNIYYASRQSLIEMGVPLGNEKQVSFPEPFENGKYAQPPKGWQG